MRITLHARSALPLLFILTLVPGTAFAQDAEIDSVRAFLVETFDAPTWIDDSTWTGEEYYSYFLGDRTSIEPIAVPDLESLHPTLRFFSSTIHRVRGGTVHSSDVIVVRHGEGADATIVHDHWRFWGIFLTDVFTSRVYSAEERERLVRGLMQVERPDMPFDIRSIGDTVEAIEIISDSVAALIAEQDAAFEKALAEGSFTWDLLSGPYQYRFRVEFDSEGNLLSTPHRYGTGSTYRNGRYRGMFRGLAWDLGKPDSIEMAMIYARLKSDYPNLGIDETKLNFRGNDLFYRGPSRRNFDMAISILRLHLGLLDKLIPHRRFFRMVIHLPGSEVSETRTWIALGYNDSLDTDHAIDSPKEYWERHGFEFDWGLVIDALSTERFATNERRLLIDAFIDGKRPYPYGRLTYHEENGCTTATLEAARRIWKMRVCFDVEGRLTEIDEDASRWYREDEY